MRYKMFDMQVFRATEFFCLVIVLRWEVAVSTIELLLQHHDISHLYSKGLAKHNMQPIDLFIDHIYSSNVFESFLATVHYSRKSEVCQCMAGRL
jgi:hypothetical protein